MGNQLIERFNRFLAWLARNIKKTDWLFRSDCIDGVGLYDSVQSRISLYKREDSYAAQDENAGTVAVEIAEEVLYDK